MLAGSQTITFHVSFVNTLYTGVLNQPVTITLLHPCKLTVISSTQTIADITYGVSTAAILTPFTAFSDTVSVAYSIPTLCALVYSIKDATIAAADGTTISGMNIREFTNNMALVGTTQAFHLVANATPQQDAAFIGVPFNVIFAHPCATSTLHFAGQVPTSGTAIVAFSGSSVKLDFEPATVNVESSLANLGLCGSRVYTIVETQPQNFITVSAAPPLQF